MSAYIAAKGSIAIDSVSLTINVVFDDLFDIMLIPHSIKMLEWRALSAGQKFNLEIDLIARFLERKEE